MPTENKSNKIITIVLAVIITLAAVTVIYISLPQNKEKTSGRIMGSKMKTTQQKNLRF
jgi:flagellar basal body-associated protein FliL